MKATIVCDGCGRAVQAEPVVEKVQYGAVVETGEPVFRHEVAAWNPTTQYPELRGRWEKPHNSPIDGVFCPPCAKVMRDLRDRLREIERDGRKRLEQELADATHQWRQERTDAVAAEVKA